MKRGLIVGTIAGVALLAAAGILSAAGAFASPAGYAQTSAGAAGTPASYGSEYNGIWVSGQGSVSVTPDVAMLTLGVEVEARTVEQATSLSAVAMEKVVSSLRANGVADKDIETQRYSISPVTKWTDDDYIVTGYRVSNMVTATIRDIDATGTIIDDAARAGGDYTRVNGIYFTVDDPSQFYSEARAEAVADATAKAQQLAQLSGVQLGAPFYISESGGYYPVYWDYPGVRYGEADVTTTPISPGETEITLSVQMAFAIQ